MLVVKLVVVLAYLCKCHINGILELAVFVGLGLLLP